MSQQQTGLHDKVDDDSGGFVKDIDSCQTCVRPPACFVLHTMIQSYNHTIIQSYNHTTMIQSYNKTMKQIQIQIMTAGGKRY